MWENCVDEKRKDTLEVSFLLF